MTCRTKTQAQAGLRLPLPTGPAAAHNLAKQTKPHVSSLLNRGWASIHPRVRAEGPSDRGLCGKTSGRGGEGACPRRGSGGHPERRLGGRRFCRHQGLAGWNTADACRTQQDSGSSLSPSVNPAAAFSMPASFSQRASPSLQANPTDHITLFYFLNSTARSDLFSSFSSS